MLKNKEIELIKKAAKEVQDIELKMELEALVVRELEAKKRGNERSNAWNKAHPEQHRKHCYDARDRKIERMAREMIARGEVTV